MRNLTGFKGVAQALTTIFSGIDMLAALKPGDLDISGFSRSNGHKATNGHTNGHAKALTNGNGHKTVAKAKPAAAVKAAPKGDKKLKFGGKAEFIRSMPDASAREVVEAAAKAGMTLTPAHVYNTRKNSPKPANATPKAEKKAAPKAAAKPAAEQETDGKVSVRKMSLPDRAAIVMGNEQLGAADVLARLNKRHWMPQASNPQAYISFTLSDNKEIFERVERGVYKVRNPKEYAKLAAQLGGTPSGKGEGVASEETEAAATTSDDASTEKTASAAGDPSQDQTALSDLGLGDDVGENPFAD